MLNKSVLVFIFLVATNAAFAQIKVLFNATKAEIAANADWQIDADIYNVGFGTGMATIGGSGTEANPQRFPTPAQSGITASTTEGFWKGGLSAWGIDCVKKGYQVETLPIGIAITYGNSSNVQDLSNYKVFVVCEPNILFTASEKTAILNFVQNGGGLMMISDHDMSDRNFDGYDSPTIWNNLMAATNPFGITFDLQDFSQTTSNLATVVGNPLLQGSFGTVAAVQFSGGTTMTLSTSANATVKGAVYKTGSSNSGTTNVMVAYCNYGSGKVVAVGDSSPADDGTGDLNDVLYDGWIADAGNTGNHRKLLMNATEWLATGTVAPAPITLTMTKQDVNCFGAATGTAGVSASGGTTPYTYKWSNGANAASINSLLSGTYTVTVTGGTTATASVTIVQPTAALTTSMSVSNITCDFPTGTMKANVFGGTPNYTYKWSNNATVSTIYPTVAGNYTVTVTDSKGCTSIQASTLTVNKQKPDATILGDTPLTCKISSVILSAQLANKDYKWAGQSLTTTQLQNTTVTLPGTYSLTITDFANGCSNTNSITVTENKVAPDATILGNTPLSCSNPSIVLSAQANGKSYKWSLNNATTQSITVSLPAVYILTVTEPSNGCSKSQTVVVQGNTTPSTIVTLATTTNATNNQKNGGATINVSGGATPYKYEWTDNNNKIVATTKDLVNVSGGVYICKITDNFGCSVFFTVVIKNVTATQDADNQLFVTVFPNPTNGDFFVEIKNNDAAFLSIYDINGRVIFQENIKNEQAISTENFVKGVYILKINTKNGSVFKKIIVQ